jgi:TRAP-type mannitol/chloroaromatic compound transport system substrate-binding protein
MKIRLQSFAPAGDRSFSQTQRFAERATELSDGRLDIEAYAAGAILPVKQEHEGLLKGAVEAIHAPFGWAEGIWPASQFISATQTGIGLTGTQFIYWDRAGGGRELAKRVVEKDPVVWVGLLTVHPAEIWGHTNRELNTLEDLDGLKFRFGSTRLAEIYEPLGVAGVVISGAEVYESMQRGVIDAFEYITPSVTWGMGFHEVCDYIYLSPMRQPHDGQDLFFSQDAWDELSPDLQQLMETVCREIAPTFFAETLLLDAEALQKIKDYGVEVRQVPAEIDAALYDSAMEWTMEKIAADPFFAEIQDSQLAWAEVCKEAGIQ